MMRRFLFGGKKNKKEEKEKEIEGGGLGRPISVVAIEPLRNDFQFCGLFKESTVAVFSYLPWGDLIRCQLVCKDWRSLICCSDALWTTNCLARGLPGDEAPFDTFMDAMWLFAHDDTTPPAHVDQWGAKEVTPQQKKVLEVYHAMTKEFSGIPQVATVELPQTVFPHFQFFAIQHFGFQHVGHMQFMILHNDEYYLLLKGDLCDPYCLRKEALKQSDRNYAMRMIEIFDESRCLSADVITKVAAADLHFLLEGSTNQQMRKTILRLLCAIKNHTKHHSSLCYPVFLQSYEDTILPEDWRVILNSLRRPLPAKVIRAEANADGEESYRSRRHKFNYKEGDVLRIIGTAKAVNKWYAVNDKGHIGPIDPADVTLIQEAGIGVEDLVDFGEALQVDRRRHEGKWSTKAPIPDYFPPTVTWNDETKEWHLKAIVFCKWPGKFHFHGSIDLELKVLHLVVGRGKLQYYEEVLLSHYCQGTALS